MKKQGQEEKLWKQLSGYLVLSKGLQNRGFEKDQGENKEIKCTI